MDSADLQMLNEQQIYLLGQIQTSQTVKLYSDTSLYEISLYPLVKGLFRLDACGCKSAADCGKDIYFWQQTVAFLQGDRKFPISALTQPTANARGKSSNVNEPLVGAMLSR